MCVAVLRVCDDGEGWLARLGQCPTGPCGTACKFFACAPPSRHCLDRGASNAVFEKAGIQSGALASAAVGATNVLGTVVAAGLMDKAGRK